MNQGSAIALIIVLGILLAFSAFFSATETAYTSFSQARMKRLAQKKKSAKRVLKLSKNYNKVLSTLLIGNNIVNIAAASLATLVFTFYFGDLGVTLSTIIMTIAVLVFGEISPKTVAKERPEEFAMLSSLPLQFFLIVFTPFNLLFDGWKLLLNKIFRLNKKRPSMTEEEFQIIVTDIKNEGVLNETEHDIIQNTIRYDETRVSSIMTKAEQIVSVTEGTPLEEVKKVFEDYNYSRIPVFSESGEVLGILYRVDFYEMMLNGGKDYCAMTRPVFYAEAGEKISVLFRKLQQEKQQIALVKQDGKIVGLISLEDILEELVGEIDDRFDEEKPLKGITVAKPQEQPACTKSGNLS